MLRRSPKTKIGGIPGTFAEVGEVNEIARKLGSLLIDSGIKVLQLAYREFITEKVGWEFIREAVAKVEINPELVQLDTDYFVTSWDDWRLIKDTTLIDRLLWQADYFDCDNFTYLFSSLAALLFRLNTCGAAYGKVYNNQTGELIAAHYFNVIVTSTQKLYVFEPMNDDFALIERGRPIILSKMNWEYRITKIYFF